MSKVIIGIDPDATAHGVAVYIDGKLEKLALLNLMEVYGLLESDYFSDLDYSFFECHIEDVNAVSAAFGARDKKRDGGIHVKLKMAQDIGQCKQAQIEVERMCEHLGIKVVKHKISNQWKSPREGKKQFEQVTGWTGRSNEDKRSAAYFGWLGVTSRA